MTIPLTGTGGLFTRLGTFAGAFLAEEGWQQTGIPAYEANILAQFASNLSDIGTITTDTASAISQLQSAKSAFTGYASSTAIQMVNSDVEQPDSQISTALKELVAQMTSASQNVNANTVGSSYTSPSEAGSALIVGVIGTDGKPLQYVYQEQIQISCTQDGQTSGNTGPANQLFSVRGAQSAPSMTDQLWPLGSGASTSVSVLNPDANGTSGDYLTNGNFEVWTSNVPYGWTISVGTAGTTVMQEATPFRGTYSLGIVGNGTELTSLTQSITSFIQPSTVYAISARVSVSSVPAAGVLSIGIAGETISVSLPGQTTSFTLQSLVFASPARLASSYTFTVALTTALSSGITVYVDDVIIAPLTRVGYGVYLGIPPAQQPFIIGDQFLLNVTNNYAGKLQNWMWRAFSLDALGITIPNSATPTIPDSVITT